MIRKSEDFGDFEVKLKRMAGQVKSPILNHKNLCVKVKNQVFTLTEKDFREN